MRESAVQQRVLPGGCPLWLIDRPGAGILSAKLWMRGGSSGDPSGQRGALWAPMAPSPSTWCNKTVGHPHGHTKQACRSRWQPKECPPCTLHPNNSCSSSHTPCKHTQCRLVLPLIPSQPLSDVWYRCDWVRWD
jgi:hypothetical protein